MTYCETCGYEVRSAANFCPNCGASINEASQPLNNAAQPPAASAGQPPLTHVSPPSTPVPPDPYVAAVALPGADIPGAAIPADPLPYPSRAIGEVLNKRYRIARKLSEGGMGAVYIAEDLTLANRPCAVKEMLPYQDSQQDKEDAERLFLREVKTLATLRHPGVPQVYDYFIECDHYYYVMEYIEGENLEDRAAAKGGKLPEREVLDYARQVAEILDYLASRSEPVVHRDIKPGNLILDKATNTVKLVDFGLAKSDMTTQTLHKGAAAGQRKSSALGTKGYAPPEQYQGRSEPKSDIFALGATLHYLLSGKDPADAPVLFQFAPLHKTLPDISPAFEALVARMLETTPTKRPSAAELKAALDGARPAPKPGAAASAASALPPVNLHFTFRSGAFANDVAELARNCERFWADGVYHLYAGQFDPWLLSLGRQDLVNACSAIRQRSADRSAGLEQFLHLLDPALAMPVMKLVTTSLDFSTQAKGARVPVEIEITNTGRGYLYGAAAALVPWITLRDTRVGVMAGAKQTLRGELNTGLLDEGSTQAAGIEVQTNGGKAAIPVQLKVVWPPKLGLSTSNLDFGAVLVEEHGRQVAQPILLRNKGGGTLTVQLLPLEKWLAVSTPSLSLVSGQSATVYVTANSSEIPALNTLEGQVVLQTNAGVVPLRARLGVKRALYDFQPRALRWAGYLSLIAAAWLCWSLIVATLPSWMAGGQPPIDRLPAWLRDSVVTAMSDLFWTFLPALAPYVVDLLSLVYLLLIGVFGLVPLILSDQFIEGLDEIENFHSGGRLTADPPVWNSSFLWKMWTILAVVACVGAMFGLFEGGYYSYDVWARLGIGVVTGIMLAFSAASPGMKPGLLRRLGAMLGMAFVGSLVSMHTGGNLPVIWVFTGMLLTTNLTGAMPQRARWLLVYLRPALFTALSMWLAISLLRALTGLFPTPLQLFFGPMPAFNLGTAFFHLLWIAGGLGMLLLTLFVEQEEDHPLIGIPRVFLLALALTTGVGVLFFSIFRLPFSLFDVFTASWLNLFVTFLACAAAGLLMTLYRKPVQKGLLAAAQALSAPQMRSLPAGLDGYRLRFGRWLSRVLGPMPLENLTTDLAARAVAAALLITPSIAYLLFSSLWLIGCLLALAVPIGLIVFLALYLSKKSAA